jgi:hypothetical protein
MLPPNFRIYRFKITNGIEVNAAVNFETRLIWSFHDGRRDDRF